MRRWMGLLLAIAIAVAGCTSAPTLAPLPQAPPPSGAPIADMRPVEQAAEYFAVRYGREHVIVVYDIDNTLLAMDSLIGSDQWVNWQLGTDAGAQQITRCTDCFFRLQGLIYLAHAMRVTSRTVPEVVGGLHDAGFTEWVLTSRSPEYAPATLRELWRRNLHFSPFENGHVRAPVGPADAYDAETLQRLFTPDEQTRWKLGAARPVLMTDGVYFTTGQHKGAMLRLLLDRLRMTDSVRAIVYADDTPRHVTGMQEAFADSKIDLRAYRYAAEDEHVREMDDATTRQRATDEWCGFAPNLQAITATFEKDVLDLAKDCTMPIEQCFSTRMCAPPAKSATTH